MTVGTVNKGRLATDESAQASFLYLPADVAHVLERLPHLKPVVADPIREGTRSGAFPAARRSPLQIYRILANDHYDHLRELLESLNFCARAGYLPPKLVKRRDRARFDSDLAEARLAEHLLRNEVGVQDLDAQKGSELTPEFIAHANDLDLAVEVYAPRTRLGLDLLMDELQDPVKNLDEPIDFRFDIRVDQLSRADSEQRPLWLHPTILGRGLDAGIRLETVGRLMHSLMEQLQTSPASATAKMEIGDLNIRVEITLTEIRTRGGELPNRLGWIHDPPLSGYAPEGIFANLVQRRVSAKLRKGQGPKSGVAPVSLLGIDMAHCNDLTTELSHPGYRADFEATLEKHLKDLHGYDFVVIYEPGRQGQTLVAHFVISDEGVETKVRDRIYGLFDVRASIKRRGLTTHEFLMATRCTADKTRLRW